MEYIQDFILYVKESLTIPIISEQVHADLIILLAASWQVYMLFEY